MAAAAAKGTKGKDELDVVFALQQRIVQMIVLLGWSVVVVVQCGSFKQPDACSSSWRSALPMHGVMEEENFSFGQTQYWTVHLMDRHRIC